MTVFQRSYSYSWGLRLLRGTPERTVVLSFFFGVQIAIKLANGCGDVEVQWGSTIAWNTCNKINIYNDWYKISRILQKQHLEFSPYLWCFFECEWTTVLGGLLLWQNISGGHWPTHRRVGTANARTTWCFVEADWCKDSRHHYLLIR